EDRVGVEAEAGVIDAGGVVHAGDGRDGVEGAGVVLILGVLDNEADLAIADNDLAGAFARLGGEVDDEPGDVPAGDRLAIEVGDLLWRGVPGVGEQVVELLRAAAVADGVPAEEVEAVGGDGVAAGVLVGDAHGADLADQVRVPL